mmetsp:Transcript_22344/g.32551  ORF Transcript_22344/g.32551 Transcript_22344/m.32551 type:complete len:480 (+) Transcript_22344:65-1504(+)
MVDNFGFRTPHPDNNNSDSSYLTWLKGKAQTDSAEGYWRIHDSYYDLTEFASNHPGGAEWIQFTQGHDITELFESHHPNMRKVKQLLNKFLIDTKPEKKRNTCGFTFDENGFYCTLRNRAWEVLEKCGTGPTTGMLVLHSSLLALFLVFIVVSVLPLSGKLWWLCSVASGFFLSLLAMCSHNFYHQKNSWRNYCFDLSIPSSHEWRVTHCYSHHTYPNTAYDFEVSSAVNVMNFYPVEHLTKVPGLRSIITMQIVFLLGFISMLIRRHFLLLRGSIPFRLEYLLPHITYLLLVGIYSFAGSKYHEDTSSVFSFPLTSLLLVYMTSSYFFLSISLAAGHHHPDIWHDGDLQLGEKIDWGILQLCAVGEKPDIDHSMVLSSVSFGRHVLHHLFPTVDNSKLYLLQPVLERTCADFNIKYFDIGKNKEAQKLPIKSTRQLSAYEGWIGMWRQLWRSATSSKNFVTYSSLNVKRSSQRSKKVD